jgi:MFS family permease
MPWIGRTIGLSPALFGSLVVIAIGIMAMAYFRSYGAWLALRFVIGLAAAVHWILSEAWINTLAPPGQRGVYVGIYGAIILSGFALGPIVLTIVPIDGVYPFALIAVSVLVSGIPIFLLRDRLPKLDDRPPQTSLALLGVAPIVFLASLASGLADGALWTLLTVYGIDKGIGETGALYLLAALNIGTVLLQIPIGWLADRIGAVNVLYICAATGIAGGLALPFVITGPNVLVLWTLAFVWGAFLASLYTVGLIELGRRFEGAALADANGLFVSGYSIGGLIGPLACGMAMDSAGADALPASIVLVCGLFLASAFANRARRLEHHD